MVSLQSTCGRVRTQTLTHPASQQGPKRDISECQDVLQPPWHKPRVTWTSLCLNRTLRDKELENNPVWKGPLEEIQPNPDFRSLNNSVLKLIQFKFHSFGIFFFFPFFCKLVLCVDDVSSPFSAIPLHALDLETDWE